jgi:hypothetical protein
MFFGGRREAALEFAGRDDDGGGGALRRKAISEGEKMQIPHPKRGFDFMRASAPWTR